MCKMHDVTSIFRGGYLDSVLGIVATPVHIKTGMHATAEVSPLRDGAGDRQANQRCIMDTAFIKSPVGCGLNGVGPELKHPSGDQAQQNHREQGDVVDAMLGFHPGDKRRTP